MRAAGPHTKVVDHLSAGLPQEQTLRTHHVTLSRAIPPGTLGEVFAHDRKIGPVAVLLARCLIGPFLAVVSNRLAWGRT